MFRHRRGRSVALLLALLALGTFLPVATVSAAVPQVGTKDQSFSGAGEAPSGSKPESKLWFNDGIWWGEMWSSSAAAFRIFRLNGSTWVDAGTTVDTRGTSKGDALWDGSKLYIASHDEATDSSHNTAGRPATLSRFSYNASTDQYSLDAGFPATITTVATETMVIDKDSTGMLWATWTQGKAVKIAHTTGNDASWSAPITLPVTGATALNSDDVSTLIAFGGNKIGLMWSNQSTSHMSFSTHRDGDPETTWSATEFATTGSGSADDHINLKTDSAGRVYAAVKTSLTASSATLTQLLVRGSGGGWNAYRFGTVAESNTRPIVELDEVNGVIHMYATGPYPGKSSGQSGGTIYEKTTSMSSPSAFVSGTGTPVIQDPSSSDMNNASSTKQNVSPTTGIVVIATNDTKDFYWHSRQTIGGGSNTTPTANAASQTTAFNTAATVALTGTDPETCQLTFAIVTPPAHGALGTITNNACTAGTPNTDSASVVYTPTAGYSGPDSFTYTVNDGTATSAPATATLAVNANSTPTANATSKSTTFGVAASVALSGTDPETCELTFAIVSGPTNGSLGTITGSACTPGTPNGDAATVTFTPNGGYSGSDSFTYTVSDGTATSAPATASLTVGPNTTPTANATSKTTTFDVPASVALSGTDPETCQLTFQIVSAPANGTLGSITDSACTAGSPNSDAASVTYTPASGFSGTDSFTYTVNDGTATSAPATASLTVGPNTVPTANPVSKTTAQDTPVTVGLSGTDPETCELTFAISVVTPPSHGSLGTITNGACTAGSPNSDGATVVYTPEGGYSGSDSFEYTVGDGVAISAPATVSLTVSPNTAPTALPTSKTVPYETGRSITLSGQDAESCGLSFTISSQPTHGTLGTAGNNACTPGSPNTSTTSIVYTPNAGYSGTDSFGFTVSDGVQTSTEASVTITVSDNVAPTANATSKSVGFQTPATVNLSGSDAERCDLVFQVVSGPAHGGLGSITNSACTAGTPNTDAATVTYTPNAGYSGPDSFTYTVSDGTTTSAPATATLTVAGGDTTLTLNPIADAYVSSSNLTGNYGTITTMKVREGAGDAANPNYRTYLKFDVSGVGPTVTVFQLKLFVTDASANLESVYVVGDSTWAETTITYTNAPAISGSAIGTTQAAPVGAYVTISLDPTKFPTGTSQLTLAIKSSATDSFVVSSREDPTNKPQLIVTSH